MFKLIKIYFHFSVTPPHSLISLLSLLYLFSSFNEESNNLVSLSFSFIFVSFFPVYFLCVSVCISCSLYLFSHFNIDQYEFLKVEKQGEKKNVALIQLNRPRAMNALNDAMISELNSAIDEAESDKDIGAIVLTGSHRAFAGKVACLQS